MSNKAPDNTVYWTDRLNALDSLPGEPPPLDKTAAWNSLHERLQKKPHRKIAFWHPAAAACLLAALLTPLLLTNRNGPISVKMATSATPHKVVNASVAVNDPHTTVTLLNTAAQVEQKNIRAVIHPAATVEPIAAATVSPVDIMPVIEKNTLLLPDTARVIAAITPVKTKLQVVHINEIAPPAAAPVSAGFIHHTFHVRLNSQDASNTQTVFTATAPDNSFQVKLLHQN